MKEAAVRIVKLSKEESELMEEEAREKNRRDKVAELAYAREEGMEKGMKKGRDEGREEGRALIALNMLKKNSDITFISEVTGLTQSEILKLKKSLH